MGSSLVEPGPLFDSWSSELVVDNFEITGCVTRDIYSPHLGYEQPHIRAAHAHIVRHLDLQANWNVVIT
jgi:hypothetical protein